MPEMSSTFWIILTGALATGSCALLGTWLVLRRMAMLGDALSHAILPGIAIAFLLSGSRDVIPMFVGAAAFGMLTTALVEVLNRRWRVQEDASIGIVFTSLFAFGVLLITAFAGQVDLDQECVLYGEIAYTPFDILIINGVDYGPRPVWILGFVFLLNLLFLVLFYKELLLASFDAGLAVSVGLSATVMHYALMGMVSLTTVAAFESVGAILVVAMFIVPGAAAYLWSTRLKTVLWLALVFGVSSSFLGYALASWWNSSIAAAMVVVVGTIFLISLFFSPSQGILSKVVQRRRLRMKIAQDHILLKLIRTSEAEEVEQLARGELLESAGDTQRTSRRALTLLLKQRLVSRSNGHFELTDDGWKAAANLLRTHRLWETYLSQLGVPDDHLHDPADAVEHFFDDRLRKHLEDELAGTKVDPHGKPIPRKDK